MLITRWDMRAIPFKKLLGGVSALDFLDHPAAISENNSDHPAAISTKEVGPPPTLQFHPFRGTLQWFFLTFTTINPMKWGGWKKLTTLQYSGGPTLIPPRSDIRLFCGPPRGDFFKGAQTPPPVTFQMEEPLLYAKEHHTCYFVLGYM